MAAHLGNGIEHPPSGASSHQRCWVEPDGDVCELHTLVAADGVLFGKAFVDPSAGGDADERLRLCLWRPG